MKEVRANTRNDGTKQETIPFIQAMTIMNKVSNLKYASKEEASESILAVLVTAAKMNNVSCCDMLAAVVEKALLSDDSAPHHINGIDFIHACDKSMLQPCETKQ